MAVSRIPATMRAAVIDVFGPPDVITLQQLPVPTIGPHEILIEVHAAGVGIWDAEERQGAYASGDERFPIVLGLDGAGVVADVGAAQERFKKGQRAWAYDFDKPKGGFYAEYVAVSADSAGHVPTELDLLHAGAAAVTGLTALQGIDDHLHVRHRETVLIFGASGAVGTLAVQFAKLRKATVIGTASTKGGQALVRQLGADHAFDARADNSQERLRSFAPKGIDAVLALAGGDDLERCIDVVKDGGRVAYPNGIDPEPQPRSNLELIGYDAVSRPEEFARLGHAVEESSLQVPIAAEFKLEQAVEAHERVERGRPAGRIVLRIREQKADESTG